MGDIILAGDSNWSTCNGGGAPAAGDTISLNGFHLHLDGANSSTYTCVSIAARASLGGAATAGYIVLDNATSTLIADLTAGTGGLLNAHGKNLAHTGTKTGGIGETAWCINAGQSAAVQTYVGNSTGGPGWQSPGLLIGAAGSGYAPTSVGISNGTITGASGRKHSFIWGTNPGVANYTNVVTVTNCNFVDGTDSIAWVGSPPVWNMTGNANYWQMSVNTGGGAANTKMVVAPAQNLVLTATLIYTGYLGTRTDCLATLATEAASFGNPDAPTLGTYHEATGPEIIDTVNYGPSSAWVGNYHAPDAAEVWHTAVFGPSSGTAGTKVASSITNCTATNIKAAVVIDDVTGTLASGGAPLQPP